MRRRRERRRTRFRRRVQLYMRLGIGILLILMVVLVGMKLLKVGPFTNEYVERTGDEIDALRPKMDVELLTVNSSLITRFIKGISLSFSKISAIVSVAESA